MKSSPDKDFIQEQQRKSVRNIRTFTMIINEKYAFYHMMIPPMKPNK